MFSLFFACIPPCKRRVPPCKCPFPHVNATSVPPCKRSWEALGRSWAALRRSSNDLGTTCKNHSKIDAKSMTDLGSQKGSQMAPKSIPKRTKIDDKNQCEKNTSSRPSWSRLGRILGRFGTALGLIFIDFPLVFKAFREHSRFSKNIVSRPVLSPTLVILDRFWRPKRLQDGSQNGSKTIKKSC